MTTTANPAYAAQVIPDNVGGAHTTAISIGVLVLVTIILVELAGVNRSAAIGVGFLFLSVIAIAGMTHSGSLQQFSKYPAAPKT